MPYYVLRHYFLEVQTSILFCFSYWFLHLCRQFRNISPIASIFDDGFTNRVLPNAISLRQPTGIPSKVFRTVDVSTIDMAFFMMLRNVLVTLSLISPPNLGLRLPSMVKSGCRCLMISLISLPTLPYVWPKQLASKSSTGFSLNPVKQEL
jgi:hypothetical protein